MNTQADGHTSSFLTERERVLRAAVLGAVFAVVLALLGRRR